MNFKQYDIVKIFKFKDSISWSDDGISKREPQIGDIATIIEIYNSPALGYELECINDAGDTEWLHSFGADELELEFINKHNIE